MNQSTMAEAFPLHWPAGRQRSKRPQPSRFDDKLSIARSLDELNRCLRRLGARSIVISSNMPLRKDGLPYSGRNEPADRGVAVYFVHKGRQKAFSCDKYNSIKDNIWAIAKTIEAIRGIERWGTGDMVDSAFAGFDALPAPDQVSRRLWHEVLNVDPSSSYEDVSTAYRRLASAHHPDKGGDQDRFIEIQRAWEEFRGKA